MYEGLREDIDKARRVVYELDRATPLEEMQFGFGGRYLIKREDRSAIRSYKWRGAYYKIASLVAAGQVGGVVAASAGNHAQGVAISAAALQVPAVIFMPTTTPWLKREAVRRWGGEWVTLHLCGDTFDEASAGAVAFAEQHGGCMIHPFDDRQVIAGQATIAWEMVEADPGFEVLYVPVGGGGLASGLAFALKQMLGHPCRVVGVEVEGQASMSQSMELGCRVRLEQVDKFCDGTAVREPGELNFQICRSMLDEMITVTNQEVCLAMQAFWEAARLVPEPSGAVAMAGAMSRWGRQAEERTGVIVSGGNMDFQTLPRVVRQAAVSQRNRVYFRCRIRETSGALIGLLDHFLDDWNIVDFQYGKSDRESAWPVLGIEVTRGERERLMERFSGCSTEMEWVTCPTAEFRMIPLRMELCQSPMFLRVLFPNRPGALRQLMRRISHATNICYFNFQDSGELEGRALIGFELLSGSSRGEIVGAMEGLGIEWGEVEVEGKGRV